MAFEPLGEVSIKIILGLVESMTKPKSLLPIKG